MKNPSEEKAFRTASRYMDKIISNLKMTLPDAKLETLSHYAGGYRFPKGTQNCSQAIVLKLVQLASNLRAGKLLLSHGYVYEFKIIQRLVFEATENIMILLNKHDELYDDILKEFYSENMDFEIVHKRFFVSSKTKRESVLSSQEGILDQDGLDNLNKNIMRNYDACSGYVHGRSVAIMELYTPERFCTSGLDSSDFRVHFAYKYFWLTVHFAIAAIVGVCEEWQTGEQEILEGQVILESINKITKAYE